MNIASIYKLFLSSIASAGLTVRSIFKNAHLATTDIKITNHVVRAFSQGDSSAFKCIFDYYAPAIYKVLCRYLRSRHLAEEITANVFSSLWLNRSHFFEVREVRLYVFNMTRKMAVSCLDKLIKDNQKLTGHRGEANIEKRVGNEAGNTFTLTHNIPLRNA